MLRQPALSAIWAYQRYISPRKGFGCAYRLAHGGVGCSGYAKGVIAQFGTFRSIPLILNRFAACKQAAITLSNTQTPQNGKKAKKKNKEKWYNICDFCSACVPCSGGKVKTPGTGTDCTPDCTPDCAPDCCSF